MTQPPVDYEPDSDTPQTQTWQEKARPYVWQGGQWRKAFSNTFKFISIAIDIILIFVILILVQQVVMLRGFVNSRLIEGLYYNFVLMDRAHIQTTINVEDEIQVVDEIPVVFDLPLDQNTEVVLTKDTPIKNATIYLNNQPVPLDLTLRAGTPLNIHLDLTVPVSQSVPVVLDVPVNLEVPVDIPLEQTELHDPFIGLQDVVKPFYFMTLGPNSWSEIEICQKPVISLFCDVLFMNRLFAWMEF